MRLPFDLTLPRLALDPLLATEYATKLRTDLLRVHQLARDSLSNAQKHHKDYYDRRVQGEPMQRGQLVYLNCPIPPAGTSIKFDKEWSCPLIVEEPYDDLTCRVSGENRSCVMHFNRLKPATMGCQRGRSNRTEPLVPDVTECFGDSTNPTSSPNAECVVDDTYILEGNGVEYSSERI